MTKDRFSDCTECANLRTHANPTQPFHDWQCAALEGICVGPRVMHCRDFKQRIGGECPPKADTERFRWRAPSLALLPETDPVAMRGPGPSPEWIAEMAKRQEAYEEERKRWRVEHPLIGVGGREAGE